MTVYRLDVELALTEGTNLTAVTYVEAASNTAARAAADAALRADVIMPPFDSFTIASARVEDLVDAEPS